MNNYASLERIKNMTELFTSHKQLCIYNKKATHYIVIQLPLLETHKMPESQRRRKPMTYRQDKNWEREQECIQVVNRENISLDTNSDEKKIPIVFLMKFGTPFCIILLLMYFIQQLSTILA